MAERTNEKLVGDLMDVCLETGQGILINTDGDMASPRLAILNRMAPGWKPITDPTKSMLDEWFCVEVLLVAIYPDGRAKSDIKHAKWNGEWWQGWPHYFQPTHVMRAPALPNSSQEITS